MMVKFKKKTQYPQQSGKKPAEEAPQTEPEEVPTVQAVEHSPDDIATETGVSGPEEVTGEPEKKVCGIGGCTTWYDDPAIMKRHYERVHGIPPPENLNKPKPRNPDIGLA